MVSLHLGQTSDSIVRLLTNSSTITLGKDSKYIHFQSDAKFRNCVYKLQLETTKKAILKKLRVRLLYPTETSGISLLSLAI